MAGVTIYQVAQEAGVSPSTVSNLLNGRTGRMLPETRSRVESAIRRLGYRPNRAARQLRTGRIQMLGLVVPSVANPFWGTFARHLEAAALAEGFYMLLCNSERDPDRERRYVEELWGDGIGGVVLCSSLPSLDHVKPTVEEGLGLVAFDRTAQPGDPHSVVNIGTDNVLGMRLATEHLLGLGHTRLAFVSGSIGSVNRAERYSGFRQALDTAGLPPSAGTVWSGADTVDFDDRDTAELGRVAAREILSVPNPPTAIVTINDMCALGVATGAREAGLVVGRDVSVTGYDDIMLAGMATPALTTVRQPVEEMAATAFAKLRQVMDGGGGESGQSILHRPTLVVRDSTAAPAVITVA
ncbi:LacI family DNA-binding transcriptional regulator [Streptomyces sp. CNQ085]|uniref:LacI family DNA-binding transcriptional regulator n=1 Tax=Streptomyces sp. CNQ085 TaxID=2886944 RepID=UPI001F50C04A|nr:LacI family DNA-binding transcriptional regulator [Streptomyces sp. CNQ085]MCI0384976.1 LacI family transcriptional regulator [Streptomyces sp. CNQ085]